MSTTLTPLSISSRSGVSLAPAPASSSSWGRLAVTTEARFLARVSIRGTSTKGNNAIGVPPALAPVKSTLSSPRGGVTRCWRFSPSRRRSPNRRSPISAAAG